MTERNGLAFVTIYFGVLTAVVAPLMFADNLLPIALDGLLALFLLFNLLAALVIWAPARQAWLRGHLTHPTYNQIYLLTLRPRLARVLRWVGLEPPPKVDARRLRRIFADVLTYRLLDRALIIAVVYPFLLLFLYWATGNRDGVVGGVVLFPAEPEAWRRGMVSGLFAIILFLPKFGQWLYTTDRRFSALAVQPLVLLASIGASIGVVVVASSDSVTVGAAVLVSFAAAYTFSGTNLGAGPIAITLACTYAFLVTGTSAFPFVGSVALLGFALAVMMLKQTKSTSTARAALLFCITTYLTIAVALFDWTKVDMEARGVFVFLTLLPLLNGLVDNLSYVTTLSLTQRGLAVGRHAVWLGLLDFLIAGVLFCLLGTVLVLAIGGASLMAGVPLLDLALMLRELDDWRTYWWAYAMVFSTILPTALHGIVAAFALQAWVPLSWREGLARQVAKATTDPLSAINATFLLACLWMAVLVGPILIIGLLGWSVRPYLTVLGTKYQAFLISVFELLPPVAAG